MEKFIKCGISGKQLIVERNGWKFGTRSPTNSICRALFGSGHFSSFWGHSLHFANFPILGFSEGYCSQHFHPITTKLCEKHGNQGATQAVPFLALLDCVSRAIAVARASVVRRRRPSSVRKTRFNANFCGKVALHHISRPFFPFLKILDF